MDIKIIFKINQKIFGITIEFRDITKLGYARADFSLGVQWRGKRVEELDKKVREKVPAEERENTKMNVILNFIDT